MKTKPTLNQKHQSEPSTRDRCQGMANALIESGQLDAGISLLKKLTEDFPEDLTLLRNLGFVLTNAGRHADALPYAKLLVKLEPHIGFNWLILGFCSLACQQFSEAKQALDQAIATNANDALSLHTLAELAVILNYRLAEAERAMRRVIKLESPRQANLATLGIALELQGKIGDARKTFQQIIQLDPSSVIGIATSLVIAKLETLPPLDFSNN